jgi:OOP family OmpA-OmpF porin
VYVRIYFYIALRFNCLDQISIYYYPFKYFKTNCMHPKYLAIALLICLGSTLAYGQQKAVNKSALKTARQAEKKHGMFSFGVNYSDYGFVKAVKDSSFSYAFNRKGIFKSGSSSFGFGVSYWKGLGSHFDFSGNFAGTFSNFPALFVKDDSVGKASFTPQLDLLLHGKTFRENRVINPFLTAGVGAGYFGKQLVVYAPLGVGLQFHFNSGAYIFLQAQWKMALTDGVRDDFMFYSLAFGQHKKTKKVEPKAEIPAMDTAKTEPKKDTVATKANVNTDKNTDKDIEKDTDGDGVPDKADLCPDVKGKVSGCPDTDGDGIADKNDRCPLVAGSASNNGCPAKDTDGDGVNDDEDKCPDVKGSKENAGCLPEPADSDGDGIADTDDKCPDAAGTAANNGCPMQILNGGKLIRSSGDSMTYFIRFDFDKASITSEAFEAMNVIIKALKADKTLLINIEGHADNFGQEKYNLAISQERANVARDYFMSYGIPKSRIKTAFFGSSRPYDIHQEWLNRRVEITIYKNK